MAMTQQLDKPIARKTEMLNEQEEKQKHMALFQCRQKIKEKNLDMQLVECDFKVDSKVITFYFTAEKRIDFRELVKELAGIYRKRIILRQIGARDRSKMLDGIGVCGRRLCCSSWITDFKTVTMQAAREQHLAANPARLTGVCGRLKCCLMYERDFYNEATKKFPQLAKPVETEKGRGFIDSIDVIKETVSVRYDNSNREDFALEHFKSFSYNCSKNCHAKPANPQDSL
ncbi:MAG: stage 0 sporulation protein [Chitinivibrionales bacterium]|nr:stage 0 sporulation protein [Chitinivibrionales bacterium]